MPTTTTTTTTTTLRFRCNCETTVPSPTPSETPKAFGYPILCGRCLEARGSCVFRNPAAKYSPTHQKLRKESADEKRARKHAPLEGSPLVRVVSAGRVVGKELGTRKRWSGLFSKMGLMREVCEEVVEEEEEDVVAGEQEMDEMSPRKGVSEDKVLPPAFLRALEGLRLGESGTHRLVAAN